MKHFIWGPHQCRSHAVDCHTECRRATAEDLRATEVEISGSQCEKKGFKDTFFCKIIDILKKLQLNRIQNIMNRY